jgi:hypothetical protein
MGYNSLPEYNTYHLKIKQVIEISIKIPELVIIDGRLLTGDKNQDLRTVYLIKNCTSADWCLRMITVSEYRMLIKFGFCWDGGQCLLKGR